MSVLRGGAAALFDDERAHRAFIAVSLGLAIFGGLGLAIALSVDAAQGFSFGSRWAALAQAHGHLQSVGFVGLFVIGMAFRLAPRFAGRPPLPRAVVGGTLALVSVGVVARAIGQPLSDHAGYNWLMVTGGWLELGGAALFGAAMLWVLAPRRGRMRGFALFFAAGSVWFVVQAALGASWLEDAVRHDRTVLGPPRDQLLLMLQFFGMHLMFVLGVATRALPTFFGRSPRPLPLVVAVWVLLQVALIGLLRAQLAWIDGGERAWRAEGGAIVALSAGLILGVGLSGAWGRPVRLRPAARALGWMVELALGWLVVAAALYGFFAIRALIASQGVPAAEADAVRHLIGLGVLTLLIAAMAHIVLPEFATERLSGRTRTHRAVVLASLLSIAAVMRAAPGVLDAGLPSRSDYWHMASAGIITLAVLCWFAWLFARAIRQQPILLQQVEDRIRPLAETRAEAGRKGGTRR